MPRYHGKELRKGRLSVPGQAYLTTVVTYARLPRFADWRTGRYLAYEFKREHDRGNVKNLAWVLMPDHFHWLLILQQGTLSDVMLRVKSGSARNLNRFLKRRGRVWQPGYHDHAMRRDEDLRRTARYIVTNPVRAGIVSRIGDYPLWDAVWL